MTKDAKKAISAKIARLFFEAIPPYVHRMRADVKQAAPETLSFSHFRVLSCVNRDVRTVSLIADQLGVSQPAMTKMVNGLVERGLIKKRPDQIDKRQILLFLTASGESLYQKVISKAESSLAHSLKNISPSNLKVLEEALGNLNQLKNDF